MFSRKKEHQVKNVPGVALECLRNSKEANVAASEHMKGPVVVHKVREVTGVQVTEEFGGCWKDSVVCSRWNGEPGSVSSGAVTQGNFCLNKIPLVSLLRVYQGAEQEQEKQLGGYCGKSRWDEGTLGWGR